MATKFKTETLIELVREAMERSELNRFQLAKRTGMSYSLIHGVAAGTKDITCDTTNKILSALGLRVELKSVRKSKRTEGR